MTLSREGCAAGALGALAVWLASAGPVLAEDAPPPLDHAALSALLEAYDVAGAAIVELAGCEPGPVVSAGYADLDTSERVAPETVFEAASLSKPVFAYLVLTLADEGLIDLDQPLAAFLDYPRISDQQAYGAMTPRMILTHRTGMPNWVDEATPFNKRTAPITLLAEPGEAYTYSGRLSSCFSFMSSRRRGRACRRFFPNGWVRTCRCPPLPGLCQQIFQSRVAIGVPRRRRRAAP